jgi:drug/metabolite transporter (DMT)-like permease
VTATATTVPVSNPARGIAVMVLGLAIVVGADAMTKALTASYPSVQVTWARYFFHLLPMLLGMVLLRGRAGVAAMVTTRRPAMQLVRSLAFTLAAIAIISAFALLPLAEAVAISFLAPLLMVAMSALLLREHVRAFKWVAVLVGFGGVLLIVWPGDSGGLSWGAPLALASAVLWALGQVLTRAVHDEPPLVTLFYTAAVGTAVLTVAMPFVWVPPDWHGWALMAGSGLIMGIFHFMMIIAYRLAPASTVAPFNYTQLIWAALAGWIVFGEIPAAQTFAGAAVIIAAGLSVWWRERAAQPPVESP